MELRRQHGRRCGAGAVRMHVERGNKVEGDAVYFVRMRGEQIRLEEKKKENMVLWTFHYFEL